MSQVGYAVAVKILPATVEHQVNQGPVLMRTAPPRSRLYGPEPHGAGTLWAESLSGYVSRLAWAHGVSPVFMAFEEVGPRLSRSSSSLSARNRAAGWCRFGAMIMNGNSEMATDWSETLGQLTRRPDLHTLTACQWAGGLAIRESVHDSPRWCPICYQEWREKGLPIYQPLLWMLHPVTVCLPHRRFLLERCPHCQKRQSTLASSRTNMGNCTQCKQWLGSLPEVETPHEITDDLLSWQQWVMSELDNLRSASASSHPLPWKQFAGSVATSAKSVGGIRPLARMTEIRHRIVQVWASGQHIPSFESVLKFCYALHVSPLQFLLASPAALSEVIQERMHQRLAAPPKRPAYHLLDREHALEFIRAVLDGREPPLSISQVERRLGIASGMLRYRFPKECDAILSRYQAVRSEQAQQRVSRECEEVRQVTFLLHAQNIAPSYDRVQAQLSSPHILRRPECRDAWHATRRELGLEQ